MIYKDGNKSVNYIKRFFVKKELQEIKTINLCKSEKGNKVLCILPLIQMVRKLLQFI